jgi:hypothetical protein
MIDALVLVLIAMADLALIVHLRRRNGRRVQTERMMTSLRLAVRRANKVENLRVRRLQLNPER